MDFEKLGRTIYEAITFKSQTENKEETTKEEQGSADPVPSNKETEKKVETDQRDIEIQQLKEQIKALKELTSTEQKRDQESEKPEPTLQELIERGEI